MAYELFTTLGYTVNIEGYREVCRNMLDEYSKPVAKLSTHSLLMVCLIFPEAEGSPILLEIAQQHSKGDRLSNLPARIITNQRVQNDRKRSLEQLS